MKKTKKLLSLGFTTALAMALGNTPVLAEGTTYTAVNGGQAVFEKYLTLDSAANVPNATFKFSIEPVTQLDFDGATTLKVFAGNDAAAVTGTPIIGTAVFKPGDTTYDSVQTQPDSVTVQNEDTSGTKNQDKLTLAEGKKYARKDVSVDFTGVSFKEPGVFRFNITEQTDTTNASHGITNDPDATRVMDVYVQDDGAGKLKVTGYVLQNAESNGTVLRDGTSAIDKSKGYTNNYTTHDLTFSKKVEGNQASHDEYFKFTVAISNAIAGTVYDVDLTNADTTTKTNGINTTSHTNPTKLTVGKDGTVTQEFWLQNGQSIKIQGLADKTAYSINEDAATLDKESYDPSAAITGDTKTGEDTDIAMDAKTYTVADDAITADTIVAYTNNKSGIIPTGIFMDNYRAFILLGIGCIGIVLVIVTTKRRKEQNT